MWRNIIQLGGRLLVICLVAGLALSATYGVTLPIKLANDAAKAATGNDFSGEGGSFSPNFLMNEVFEACGWEGPAYMQASNEVRETFDVVSRSGIVRTAEGGELLTWLEGEQAEIYNDFKKLEYYMKHDHK